MNLTIALAIFEYVVLLLSLSLHDAVQAYTAARLGDPTARMLGRVSLNPIRHYDLLGTIVFPIIWLVQGPLIFGWGKPIPLTTRNFKTYRDEMLVNLSGPLAHLAAAAAFLIVLILLKHSMPEIALSIPFATQLSLRNTAVPTEGLPQIFPIALFLYDGILVNLLLFAFNLCPLPSLDSGKVLRHFLPYNARQQYDQMGFYLMIAFFFFGFRLILAILSPILGLFDTLLNAL